MKAGSPCRARPSFFELRLVQAQATGHAAGVLQAIHGTVCVNSMACPRHHWGSLPQGEGGLICY
jgi:hypothetical protein